MDDMKYESDYMNEMLNRNYDLDQRSKPQWELLIGRNINEKCRTVLPVFLK